MKTLIERIQELMTELQWDEKKVASVAGVTTSAVYQWLGHGGKTIHSIGKIEAAIYLERASGFSALWLAKGQGPRMAGRASAPDLEGLLRAAAEWPESLRRSTSEMLRSYLIDPDANADLLPVLIRRLSGESLDEKAGDTTKKAA